MTKIAIEPRTIMSALRNMLFLFVIVLSLAMSAYSQITTSLEVTLNITKAPFTKRKVLTTVTIKNTGTTPIVVPKIDKDYPNDYISFEIIHQSSSTRVDFLEKLLFSDPGIRIAPATKVLRPNAQESFNLIINEFHSGLFGLANPKDPESLQKYVGFFNIRAKLTVDDNNLPTGGDLTNVFRGTVYSSLVTVFVKS